jgi:L-ascorbate metabolism protein UlaG (beta-lactamase superfamily)
LSETNLVTITWLGHAAFLLEHGPLEHGSTTVLVDPFLTGNPTAITNEDQYSPGTILITHAHNDHVGDALNISKRSGATIITTHELATYLEEQGATAIGANIGGTVQFEGGSVKLVQAVHTSAYHDGSGFVAAGAAAGLVIHLGGHTIYHAGDTALFSDMALIGDENLDVAIIPVGGHYTMDPTDAVKAVKLLHPKVVIPCHFNTFPPITQDIAAFKAAVETETQAKCIVMEPGLELTLTASDSVL